MLFSRKNIHCFQAVNDVPGLEDVVRAESTDEPEELEEDDVETPTQCSDGVEGIKLVASQSDCL